MYICLSLSFVKFVKSLLILLGLLLNYLCLRLVYCWVNNGNFSKWKKNCVVVFFLFFECG
jgi:hypothetical protein